MWMIPLRNLLFSRPISAQLTIPIVANHLLLLPAALKSTFQFLMSKLLHTCILIFVGTCNAKPPDKRCLQMFVLQLVRNQFECRWKDCVSLVCPSGIGALASPSVEKMKELEQQKKRSEMNSEYTQKRKARQKKCSYYNEDPSEKWKTIQ